MPIRRCHAARAANLDLAHRDPVIGSHHVRVEVDGARAQGVHPHGGRKRDRLLDPDLPIGIPDRNLAEAQVLRLPDELELTHLRNRAAQRDRGIRGLSGAGSIDGHEPRLLAPLVRLDDQMSHAPRLWVDHDIGQLTEGLVGAPDGTTEIESHRPSRHLARV
jgi:hypothetical protein